MPNNLTDYEENRLLDLSLLNNDKLALTTTLPTDSTAGTEVTGGVYSRQTLNWAAASSGSKTTSGATTFTSMPACEVMGWEIWDSAGTNRKWYGLNAPKTGTAAAGTDLISSTAHGLVNDDPVVFQTGYAPDGATAGTKYYVVSSSTDTFSISATVGGAAIDIATDSSLVIFGKIIVVGAGFGLSIAPGGITCTLS